MPATEQLPMSTPTASVPEVRWFSAIGSVTVYDDRCEVHVGGSLVGVWSPDELGPRNVLMVHLSREPKVRQGKLAKAFGVSPDTLRRMRNLAKTDGTKAVFARRRIGRRSSVATAQLRTLSRLFANGHGASSAHRRAGKRLGMSRTTVWRLHNAWLASREQPAEPTPVQPAPAQQSLPLLDVEGAQERDGADADTDEASVAIAPVSAGRAIQFVGAWLMIAMVAKLGLHEAVARLWNERRGNGSLRVALDAVLVGLSLGYGCIEGVRRVATATASTLLRASGCQSASWVRRVLRRFVDTEGSASLHLAMAGR